MQRSNKVWFYKLKEDPKMTTTKWKKMKPKQSQNYNSAQRPKFQTKMQHFCITFHQGMFWHQ